MSLNPAMLITTIFIFLLGTVFINRRFRTEIDEEIRGMLPTLDKIQETIDAILRKFGFADQSPIARVNESFGENFYVFEILCKIKKNSKKVNKLEHHISRGIRIYILDSGIIGFLLLMLLCYLLYLINNRDDVEHCMRGMVTTLIMLWFATTVVIIAFCTPHWIDSGKKENIFDFILVSGTIGLFLLMLFYCLPYLINNRNDVECYMERVITIFIMSWLAIVVIIGFIVLYWIISKKKKKILGYIKESGDLYRCNESLINEIYPFKKYSDIKREF